MDHDDTANNIFPLFDGLDTTPFGAPKATPAARTDAGWSAEPEPTITDDTFLEDPSAPGLPAPQVRRRGRRAGVLHLSRAAVWLAAALVSGAALASTRAMLLPTGATPRHASPTTHLPPPSYRAATPAKLSSPSSHARTQRRHTSRAVSATRRARRPSSPIKTIVQVRYVTPSPAPVPVTQYAAANPAQPAARAAEPSRSSPTPTATNAPRSTPASTVSTNTSKRPVFGANGTLAPGHSPDG